MVVVLPQPFGTQKAEDLAALNPKAHIVHRNEVTKAAVSLWLRWRQVPGVAQRRNAQRRCRCRLSGGQQGTGIFQQAAGRAGQHGLGLPNTSTRPSSMATK